LLAPPWHHQIEASGPTSEIAQVHEPEAVLRRGAAKFGGLSDNRREIRTVYATGNSPVAESKDDLTAPFITGSALLYDAGRTVGRISITRSLRSAVESALLMLLGSGTFGAATFFVIRNLPLRALRRAFADLAEEKEKAQITLQSIGDAVITTDADMRVEYINPIAEKLTGWSNADARGRDINQVFKIYNEQTRLPAANPIHECLETREIVEMENHTILVRCTDSQEFHIEDSAAPIRRADGTIFGAVMVFHDVSERKAEQSRLQHIAFHDSLTGLPNRALFRKSLSASITDARLTDKHVGVLFLDLDRFKTVNDSLGHGIGDELLILVAKRLEQCTRRSDLICRMGGDEFTAVLSSIHTPEDAGAVSAYIIQSFAKPFTVQEHELHISTSIGIAIYPKDGEDADALLKHADAAMYHAKALGRNAYQYFNSAMGAEAIRELQLRNGLRAALENKEFILEYQPKLHLEQNRIVGAEALIRWQSPEFGRVMPGDFIPNLEESGAIVVVGSWVLRTAIAQAKQWHDAGNSIVVSVNVSAHQFRQAGLVEQIAAMLKKAELPPELLQIEITESLLMDDSTSSETIMRELINIGVNISLDDFGTGYSSLSYLRRFPINELKIDRSFVVDLDTEETAKKIVKTVIELGHALGMKVTAEGVETESQRSHLQAIGCDEIQGYLLSRPLPSDVFEALFSQSRTPLYEVNFSAEISGLRPYQSADGLNLA
ncbi:putative bifunctional diguanylate cyclase/phosphodiesterase, partial [Massilia sp. DWR3-1-1]|uniref:putative bifunctional diguanylate cyclase/phosphodiesterase n=1 Tax=Massilia sp. DWR3-1-1 TaxID=2804559 RepID=UPI003CEE9E3B